MRPPAEKRVPSFLLAQSIWLGDDRTASANVLESDECPTSNTQLSLIAGLIDQLAIL